MDPTEIPAIYKNLTIKKPLSEHYECTPYLVHETDDNSYTNRSASEQGDGSVDVDDEEIRARDLFNQKDNESNSTLTCFDINANCGSCHQLPCSKNNSLDEGNNEIEYEQSYYIDDEVCRVLEDGAIEFGVVAQGGLAGPDNLLVIWTAHDRVECQGLAEAGFFEQPGQPIKIAVVDRKLQRGDLIRVVPNGEYGEVVNVEWMAYIKVVETNEAIVDVRCDLLEPILSYQVGNRIELNGWIGIIKTVESVSTVMFSDGKSCNITYSFFLPEKVLYPGKKVSFSTQELEEMGTKCLDNGVSIKTAYGESPPGGFVVFLKVNSIEVEWKTNVDYANTDSKPSYTKIKRSQLKKSVRNCEGSHYCPWDSDQTDLLNSYYYYTAKPGDVFLSIKDKELNMHIISEFFFELNEDSGSSDTDDTAHANAPAVVSVLRTCRVVDVEWKTGLVNRFRSCDILEKISFTDQFRQIVQKKNSLATSSTHEYGVTLTRTPEETVMVKWFSKWGGKTQIEEIVTTESKYDIDYHFKYGKIHTGELVRRSKECKLPEETFRFGIVDCVTKDGEVIVVDRLTNSKETLRPFDLEVVSLEDSNAKSHIDKSTSERDFLDKLYVDTTTEYGEDITIQESYFSPRLLRNYNLSTIPADEKFKILPHAPLSHYFYSDCFIYGEDYMVKVAFDRKMMRQFFAEGVWVIGYEDRLDLYSAMLIGPKGTPYEDGLFHFDIQLQLDYPNLPPNFYLTTSLAETLSTPIGLTPGSHHFSKLYTLKTLSLLEAILAVHKFIFEIDSHGGQSTQSLADEFTTEGMRNLYCQVTINVVDSLFKALAHPPTNWRYDVIRYVHATAPKIISRLSNILLTANKLIDLEDENCNEKLLITPFPVPVTEGFIIALENRIHRLLELNLTTAGPKL